jgi:hypothetical protein
MYVGLSYDNNNNNKIFYLSQLMGREVQNINKNASKTQPE